MVKNGLAFYPGPVLPPRTDGSSLTKLTFGDLFELFQDREEPLGEGRRLCVKEDLQVVLHLLLRLLVGHHHHDVLLKKGSLA